MAYKTFRVRGGHIGWGPRQGNELTLYGRFGSDTAKSFQAKRFLILVEQGENAILRAHPDYLIVEADAKTIQKTKDDLDQAQKDQYGHLEVCLTGRGIHNNQVAFSSIAYAD